MEDLWKKFSRDGEILPFFGDTVVIPVEKVYRKEASRVQAVLYETIGDLMSEKLIEDSFHITVHDLDNEFGDWKNTEELRLKMEENKKKCERIFMDLSEYLRRKPDHSKIRMRGVGILGGFVAVSIAFLPYEEKDFRILFNLHNLFEEVVPLKGDFYPHLTLGYYKARRFTEDEMRRIGDCTKKLNELSKDMELELDLRDLSYQIFKDMNHYETVMKLGNFI